MMRVHDRALERRRQARRRRKRAHAAGVGAGVAVADALVILRRGERQRVAAVDEREKARLLAGEKFLDDDLGAGLRRTGARPAPHRPPGMRPRIIGDGHALAGGEPVGLDDDRRAALGDIGFGRAPVAKRR